MTHWNRKRLKFYDNNSIESQAMIANNNCANDKLNAFDSNGCPLTTRVETCLQKMRSVIFYNVLTFVLHTFSVLTHYQTKIYHINFAILSPSSHLRCYLQFVLPLHPHLTHRNIAIPNHINMRGWNGMDYLKPAVVEYEKSCRWRG